MSHASRSREVHPAGVGAMPEPGGHAEASLPDFDPAVLIELDLRDDLRSGREPMTRILAATDALPAGGVLHLRTPFEPVPLFAVLARRGLAHHTEAFAADDWSSWFWRSAAPPGPATTPSLATAPAPAGVLDLRHLPAPEPLVAIMARITREDAPFDVLLPFDPPILDTLLAPHGWCATRIHVTADAAQLRIAPAGAD